jgi:hypothetical protein
LSYRNKPFQFSKKPASSIRGETDCGLERDCSERGDALEWCKHLARPGLPAMSGPASRNIRRIV